MTTIAADYNPTFAAVITTHNRKHWAAQAVLSVQQQTYKAQEIIVVVDCDNDGTEAFLKQEFPGITVIVWSENVGVAISRNTGIAHATADFVCLLDDDDLWHPKKLEVTAQYIKANPDAKAINSPVWFFSDADGPQTLHGFNRDFIAADLAECCRRAEDTKTSRNQTDFMQITGRSFEAMLERNCSFPSAITVDRLTAIKAGGFSPCQRYAEDWLFSLNVSRLCEWHALPDRLTFYRLHGAQSTTRQKSNMISMLSGFVFAWYPGETTRRFGQQPVPEALAKFGPTYRFYVQLFFWSAIKSLDFPLALNICMFGYLLLPRWQDKLYALTPPSITWRIERYIFGMHKPVVSFDAQTIAQPSDPAQEPALTAK